MPAYSQPGIINVLDYGMTPGMPSVAPGNTTALQSAINAAQNSANPNGAIILIPSFYAPNYGAYWLDVSAGPITIPDTGTNTNLLICGTGNGTTLTVTTAGGTLFSMTGGTNGSSVAFQDLTISYDIADGSGGLDYAFYTSDYFASLFRVNVIDCQNPLLVEGGFMTVLDCAINYDTLYPSSQSCTGILIKAGASQVNIEQCSLSCANVNTSSIGIQIDNSHYARVTDTQISGFQTGLQLLCTSSGGASRGATMSGLEIDATGTCILVGPSNQPVQDASFVNCTCQPTTGSTPATSGILLSLTTGGSMSNVDNIRFPSCSVVGYPVGTADQPVYGLQIDGGQHIQITGGTYSGNGTAGIAITAAPGNVAEVQIDGANCVGPAYAGSASATTQLYGIYLAAGQDIQITGANCSGNGTDEANGIGIYLNGASEGALQDVRIVGAICSGAALGGDTAVQQYGIYAAIASQVVIDGCALTGNTVYGAYLLNSQNVTVTACDLYSGVEGAKGVYVDGSGTPTTQYIFIRNCNGAEYPGWGSVVVVEGAVENLEVTNCAGYNDLGADAVLADTTSAPSGSFSGITYSYYGPTAFYVAGATGVTIDGYATALSQGAFNLAPGETAEVSGATTHFLMISK